MIATDRLGHSRRRCRWNAPSQWCFNDGGTVAEIVGLGSRLHNAANAALNEPDWREGGGVSGNVYETSRRPPKATFIDKLNDLVFRGCLEVGVCERSLQGVFRLVKTF